MENNLKIFTIMFLLSLLAGGLVHSIKGNTEKKYILQVLCDSLEDCEKLQAKQRYRFSSILILTEERK